MAVFDLEFDDFDDEEMNDIECEHPHNFNVGDKVFITGIDNTDNYYGANPEMVAMVGQVYQIITVDPYDGACILGPQELAFHHLDLLSEKEAKKQNLLGKVQQYANIDPLPWMTNTFSSEALSGGACSIKYILYRPKKGEVAKRPTFKQLQKRAAKQRRKAYRYDASWGYKRMTQLDRNEMVFPYTTWESQNRACFAALRRQPKNFQHENYWNGKPPTWFCYQVDSQVVRDKGRLLMWEVVTYIKLLMEYGLAPPDIDLAQLEKYDTVSFRLKKYGMNHLFGMLNCIRYVHEYPSVARQTLYFMQNGFNFYISFILAHKFGGRSHGSHSLLSTYQWNGFERLPHELLKLAWKLEKYFLKDAHKEKSMRELDHEARFEIQHRLAQTAIDKVPVIKTWQQLMKEEPLFWKSKTNKE